MNRNKALIAAALAICATHAHAQYKCTGQGGSISFQQTPCASSAKSERLAIQPPPATARQPQAAPIAATAATESADMRIVKTMERDRRVRELTEQISRIETTVAGRSSQMAYEMEQLKNQKTHAKNNLAGATWEQSISTEMAAVAQKYRAMNEADLGRLPSLRAELTKVQEQK